MKFCDEKCYRLGEPGRGEGGGGLIANLWFVALLVTHIEAGNETKNVFGKMEIEDRVYED